MFDYDQKAQHWINRASFRLRAAAAELLADAGIALTPEEWALLMVLWQEDGGIGIGALAGRTLRDRTTVSRLVGRLEGKGLVERIADPDDGRAVVVALTAEGQAAKPAVLSALAPLHTGLTADIDPAEIAACIRVCRAICDRLDGEDPRP